MLHRMQAYAFRCFVLLLLLAMPAITAWSQNCTTNPFDQGHLPLCDPGGDGGGTIGPEDLVDFIQASNGSWSVVDASLQVGVQVLGAPPGALQVGNEYRVYVPDGNTGHLQEFIRTVSGAWIAIDLVAAVGQSFSTSVPSAIMTSNGTRHVFVVGNGHLLDFVKAPGSPWTLTDVSALLGLSSSFSPVGAVAATLIGSDIHVYAFANSDLQEYFLPSGGSWIFTDVSVAVGGVQIASAPSTLNTGAVQVYAAGTSGHLLDFQGTNFTASGGTWQVFDQTANSGGSILFAGLPYVPPSSVVYGNSVQVFMDGGPNGAADLESLIEVNGQWQTFNLSGLAINGQPLGIASQPFVLLDGANIHVYVPAQGGHLVDFFKEPNPANWVATDVSAATGSVLMGIGTAAFRDHTTGNFHVFANSAAATPQTPTPSPLTTFTMPDTSSHTVYRDSSQHLIDLFMNTTGIWQRQDLTAATGSALASSGGGLASIVNAGGCPHVFYVDTNQHINSVYLGNISGGCSSTWSNEDLTADSGAGNTAVAGSPISTVGASNDVLQEQFYIGANNHLYRLYWPSAGGVFNQDLTALTGGPQVGSGSGLASIVNAKGDEHIFYLDTNKHVNSVFISSGNWGNEDLTADSGAGNTAAGSPLTTVGVTVDALQNQFYVGANNHIYRLFWPSSGGVQDQDVTAAAD